MKKTLSIAAAGLFVAGAVGATPVLPKLVRTYGDQTNEGGVTAVVAADSAALSLAFCTSLGHAGPSLTGVGIVGSRTNFVAVTRTMVGGTAIAREDDDFTHDITTVALFDAADLKNAAVTGHINLVLDNFANEGYGGSLQVRVVPDRILRLLFTNNGPFHPNGSNQYNDLLMDASAIPLAVAETVRFEEFITDRVIPLSSGPSVTLDVCLGPTGQVRLIDADNNGDWATECVAGGWRPESIPLSGQSPFAAALDAAIGGAPLTTYARACADATAAGPAMVVNNPILISISGSNAGLEQDRTQEDFLERFLPTTFHDQMVLQNPATYPTAAVTADSF